VLGWFAAQGDSKRTLTLGLGTLAVLLLAAFWVGTLRPGGMKQARYRLHL
jgi:hypothetical protein